jgi:hypothetical protein
MQKMKRISFIYKPQPSLSMKIKLVVNFIDKSDHKFSFPSKPRYRNYLTFTLCCSKFESKISKENYNSNAFKLLSNEFKLHYFKILPFTESNVGLLLD